MIYTESKNYKIKVKSYAIKVGEKFKDLNLDVKQSLEVDTGTSDKLKGDWYISPHGYLISVDGGVITGIGVSPINIDNHTK